MNFKRKEKICRVLDVSKEVEEAVDALDCFFFCREDAEQSQFPHCLYEYDNFSLEEVVVLAKNGGKALEEYSQRISLLLDKYANLICSRNHYISYPEVVSALARVSLRAVDIYDKEMKTPFLHLLRAMLFKTSKAVEKETARKYAMQTAHLGNRVYAYSDNFADSCFENDESRKIIQRIDLEEILKTLNDQEKELLLLYSQGYTFKRISEIVCKPLSTVANQIYRLVDLIKEYLNLE